MERCPAWLRSQPGYKVAHGRQIGRDCFGITRPQSRSELLEDGWVIARHQSSLFPTFPSKRFSDKILQLTLSFSLLFLTKQSVGMGGTWPRRPIPRRVFSDKMSNSA